jgi:hypothetical protein
MKELPKKKQQTMPSHHLFTIKTLPIANFLGTEKYLVI